LGTVNSASIQLNPGGELRNSAIVHVAGGCP
jgi:hypothetical protein